MFEKDAVPTYPQQQQILSGAPGGNIRMPVGLDAVPDVPVLARLNRLESKFAELAAMFEKFAVDTNERLNALERTLGVR